jgi:hypothetical protein
LDILGMLMLSGALGLLITAHVALVAHLFARTPRWHGLLALAVPPLAPYWGFQERRYVWGALWLLSALAYVLSLAGAVL